MTLILALLLALVGAGPSVSLKVTQNSEQKNVHLTFTVTGPYEGRVCVDVDSEQGEHAGIFCADEPVSVKAGASVPVQDSVHGPAGAWVLTPGLPDTSDEKVIVGEAVHITVHAKGPGASAERASNGF